LQVKDVEALIRLAESRIGFEKSQQPKEPDVEIDEVGKWFLFAQEDNEKRSFIFSEASYAKLSELQNFRKWIEWNKEQYEASKAELQSLMEKEIARSNSADGEDATLPKWKVFVTFVSDSHTIRPSFISEWAKTSTHFLVGKTAKNNELTCQFLLPKQVTIGDAYDKGWIMAKVMAIALNIGTFGYFWWYVPKDGYFYTDRIIDLENDMRLKFENPQELKIEWKREALKAENVFTIKLVFAYLVRIRNQKEEEPLNTYLTGLSLFGKCDCHLNFIANAFESFFKTLKSAMSINGDRAEHESLYEAASRYLGESITDSDALKRHLEIGQIIEDTKQGIPELQMNDVASIKSYCDAYFLLRAAIVVRDSVATN
jgi:hypothetical protein